MSLEQHINDTKSLNLNKALQKLRQNPEDTLSHSLVDGGSEAAHSSRSIASEGREIRQRNGILSDRELKDYFNPTIFQKKLTNFNIFFRFQEEKKRPFLQKKSSNNDLMKRLQMETKIKKLKSRGKSRGHSTHSFVKVSILKLSYIQRRLTSKIQISQDMNSKKDRVLEEYKKKKLDYDVKQKLRQVSKAPYHSPDKIQ